MRLADAAGDLFLGSCCPGCDEVRLGLCPDCAAALRARSPLRVPGGERPQIIVAAGECDDLLLRLISAHKERSAWHLAGILAEQLATAVEHLRDGTDLPIRVPLRLAPVPSTRAAVRSRGYDATWAIARRAAGQLRGISAATTQRLLVHRRAVHDQSGLDRQQRASNLAGAMAARGPTPDPGAAVVIVDDLVTTGASVAEASRALTAAGHRVLGAAVIGAVR